MLGMNSEVSETKTRSWRRIETWPSGAIVLAVVVVAFVGVALVLAASHEIGYPTCADVAAGKAQLSNGQCYSHSAAVHAATAAFVYAGAAAVALSIFLAVGVVWRNAGGRLLAPTLGLGIVLFAIAVLVARLSPAYSRPSSSGSGNHRMPALRSADERQALAVAERYLHAFAKGDWRGACATRTQAEQNKLARLAGSCARAFEVNAQRVHASHPGFKLSWEATYYPTHVSRRGSIIGVHFTSDLFRGTTKLAAVNDRGQWRLEDLPDNQIP